MNTPSICSGCGKRMPSSASERFCNACLFALALFPKEDRDQNDSSAGKKKPPGPPKIRYFGDYEVIEEIARGGMGVVFKARQVSLNRIVAVKAILSGDMASIEEYKRFQTEAEGTARLHHPNIVAIHEIGHHDGRPYFSMEFVEGRTLAAMMIAEKISFARAAEFVRKIAEAVHHAHEQGILHRDLKPQNVLIDQMDQPRITDFGVAKILDKDAGLTRTDGVVGTPSYMSPEQAAGRNEHLSAQSDVYSLGAILYELLTEKKPFRGVTPAETIFQVMEQAPVAPCRIDPLIPKDLETICLKCLEKSPHQRYVSAQQLAEDLGRFLKGETIVARSPSVMMRVRKWTLRNPWSLTGLTSLIVLGLGALCFGFWQETRYLAWRIEFPGVKPDVPFHPIWLVFLGLLTFLGTILAFLFHVSIYRRKYQGKPLRIGRLMAVGTALSTLALTTLSMVITIKTWRGSRVDAVTVWLTFSAFWYGAVLLWHGISQKLDIARGRFQASAPFKRVKLTDTRTIRSTLFCGAHFGATVLAAVWLVPKAQFGTGKHEALLPFGFCGLSILIAGLPNTFMLLRSIQRPILLEIAPILTVLSLFPLLALFSLMPTSLALQAMCLGLLGALFQMKFNKGIRIEPIPSPSWESEIVPRTELLFHAGALALVLFVSTTAMFFVKADEESKILFVSSTFWLTLFGLLPVLVARNARPEKRRRFVILGCVGYGGFLVINVAFDLGSLNIVSAITSLIATSIISLVALRRPLIK